MGEPKGKLVTPVADNPDDELRSLEVDANDYLKVVEQGTPTIIAKPHADEKLFGFESVINKRKTVDATGTNFWLNSDTVGSGKIWKITHVAAWNKDGDIANGVILYVYHDATDTVFHRTVTTIAEHVTVDKAVELYLDVDDFISCKFQGVVVGEACYLNIFGYEMNVP